ncbi:MAG: DinB family protein [Ginsengibacter sp.]
MTAINRKGTVGALLYAYRKVIAELQQAIVHIDDKKLATIADAETADKRCASIQTILTHVVAAGYSHANYIRQAAGAEPGYHDDVVYATAGDYRRELDAVFSFISDTFKNIKDEDLEQFDNDKKVITKWGQYYDIEQMAEHAIVHFIKHTRQIKNFEALLSSTQSDNS